MLLDACGCELPNEGRRADVSSRGLVEVVREDLTYFSRLQVVDAGDNSLPFESFSGLPRIEELFVPCNNIREIGSMRGRRGYGELRRLDLSYNNLSAHALSALALLPSLLDLDLTCNGLTELPSDMGNLPRLQKLSLERNQLESDGVIDILSMLPALRELNLSFNYFTGIHFTPQTAEYAFPLLEVLDLGFNYVGHETHVEGLIFLEQLQRIILYGNPLAGPTGEDPLGLCVEALITKADRVREGWVSNPIEVITEMPRKRSSRGVGTGGTTGRRLYSDIGITMVDDGRLPSALDFRDGGNASLFSFETRVAPSSSPPPDGGTPEERQYQQQQQQQQMSAEGVVELTLRTARERWNKNPQARSTGGTDLGRVDDMLTSMEAGMDEMTLENRAKENEDDARTSGRRGLSAIIRTVNAVLDESEY
ncbi:unnamed protein product [Sphacelaria rigidula]